MARVRTSLPSLPEDDGSTGGDAGARHRAEPSLAGAQAAMMGGFALLLILASGLLWLIGAAIAFRGPDAGERNFP